MMKYLVMWPGFGQHRLHAEIVSGFMLRCILNRNDVLPTGIYRLDALRDPVRLYLATTKGTWILQDKYRNLEYLPENE